MSDKCGYLSKLMKEEHFMAMKQAVSTTGNTADDQQIINNDFEQ